MYLNYLKCISNSTIPICLLGYNLDYILNTLKNRYFLTNVNSYKFIPGNSFVKVSRVEKKNNSISME